jgi:ankyrin repeat protein
MLPQSNTELEKNFLVAAARGDLKTVKKCLAAGVAINTTDQFQETALFKAVFSDHWNVAAFLMEQGINVNIHPNHANNTTFLHSLCYESSTPEETTAAYFILDFALNKYGAHPNPLDRYGDTPLDRAYQRENIPCIRLLTKAGGIRSAKCIGLEPTDS